jgi:hypothetical protein
MFSAINLNSGTSGMLLCNSSKVNKEPFVTDSFNSPKSMIFTLSFLYLITSNVSIIK